MRRFILLAAMALPLCGCYENASPDELGAPETVAETPPPAAQPASTPSPGNTGSSALGGSKRAAENTVDRINQRQQELLRQMEEDE